MQKTLAGVVGAVGALAAAGPATAAEHAISNPASYKELLQPIPNARELLRRVVAAEAEQPKVMQVQYWAHHHHHHHNGYYRRWHHHHHHHHHGYYGYGYYPPAYGYGYYPPPPYYYR